MPVLARVWQMLLKGLEEVQTAPSPIRAAEMVLVRLAYVADLPAPAELVEELSRRYIQMYEQITGMTFKYGATPILPRIERNLKPYAV